MHVDKHFWAVKIHWTGDYIDQFSLYQLSEIENWEVVGYTHVRTIEMRTKSVDDGIQELFGVVPSHYVKFMHGENEWRVYHNHDGIWDSRQYDISHYKGYLYLLISKCGLWEYHDEMFIEAWGHVDNDEKPIIIKVKDIEDVFYSIPSFENGQSMEERQDVFVPIVPHQEYFPDLGIDVIEMNEIYKTTEAETGLFIFWVDKENEMYKIGFRDGDVIKSITRMSSKKTYRTACLEDLKFALEKIYPNEQLLITYSRDGVEGTRLLKEIKFSRKKFEHFQKLQYVRKAIFDIWLDVQYLKLGYPKGNEKKMEEYEQIHLWVDDSGTLKMKSPGSLNNVTFELDNKGNIVLKYGQQ